jgi:hypothetical protein
MGGSMIGMGVGIGLIFPVVLGLFNLPITNYMTGAVGMTPAALQNLGNGSTNTAPDSTSGILYTILNSVLVAVLGPAVGTIYAAGATTGGSVFFTGLVGLFIGVAPGLNFVTTVLFDPFLQFFLIIFDIIIVYTAANNVANLLGGSITPGLGRTFRLV